jgi:hypothetical protein
LRISVRRCLLTKGNEKERGRYAALTDDFEM